MIEITPNIALNENELKFEFFRGSGPGGQNINKVSTAVRLYLNVADSPSIPLDVRQRLTGIAGRQMTADGRLIITARQFRTQEQNRQDALNRLIELIRRATERPKIRHKKKLPRSKNEKRLSDKHRRSETKRMRRSPSED